MSDRPLFIYAATYSCTDDAWGDYDILVDLHAQKLVGTYDAAAINKDDKGKVHVRKHEKATQHGAWEGSRSERSSGFCSRRRSSPRGRSAASSVASADTSARASPTATRRSSARRWTRERRRWS